MTTLPSTVLTEIGRRTLPPAAELNLLRGPYVLLDGRRVDIPDGGKRLLVYLALRGGRGERRQVAGALWPIGDDVRAAGNLRSALWRLKGAGLDLLAAGQGTLALAEHVRVDVDQIGAWAARLVAGRPITSDLAVGAACFDALDLLPGWYEDWALIERERLRQRMLHALEALSGQLSCRGQHAEAIEVALTVVHVEPLRESSQRVLMEAHLAEGNFVEAQRCLSLYRDLMDRELGVGPSDELVALVMSPQPRHHCVRRTDSLLAVSG